MDKYKFWIKVLRIVLPTFMAGIIVIVSIIMYDNHGALPDAMLGVIIGSGMGVIGTAVIGNHKSEEKSG